MKKYDFKKMAALGLTLGLSVAAPSSACCGKDKQDKNDSSDLLSSLNKNTEFYLAGHGCGGSSSGCGGQAQNRGTGTSRGTVAMDDSNLQNGARMQGQGAGQQGNMQGTDSSNQMQGSSNQMQGSRGYFQGSSGQSGQVQGNGNHDQQSADSNVYPNGNPNGNPNANWRQNNNNQRNTQRSSGGCGGISTISGLNT